MITFHPKQGMVLICDFTGFKPPEMVKRRPVVVVSPRYRRHTGVCLVVPLSTVPPPQIEAHHYEIAAGSYDFLDPCKPSWAKCDMLTCVSFERLDRVLMCGRYASPALRPADFIAIQHGVMEALGVHPPD
jgi:mRNA interferase MazF